MAELPAAPDALVDERGQARFGAWSGRVADSSLARLEGEARRQGWRRLASEKRWHFAFVAAEEFFAGAAIVQLGYLANTFLYVFDRRERRMLVERSFLVPPPLVTLDDSAARGHARLRHPLAHVLIEASASEGRFEAHTGRTAIEVSFRPQAAPPPLTAICPVLGGGVTLTQKTVCVPADGEVRAAGRTFRFKGALAGLDYSHGYLGRETRWRWAMACGRLKDGRTVGLNLVEGHNDGAVTENGLWIDGRLSQPGHAYFEFDERDPLRPWRIRTDDGRIDLGFASEGARSEDIDLKLIVSQYVQLMGSFSGTVKDESGAAIPIAGLPGVVERHRARW